MAITPVKVMQISDKLGGKLDSHVFYAKYMKIMKADFVGKLMSSINIVNRESYMGSGTAIYTRFFIPQLENYKDGTSPNRTVTSTRFEISISEMITAKYDFEDFDLAMIESSFFTTSCAEGLAKSTIAMWDAEVADLALKTGIANGTYIKMPSFSKARDTLQMEMDNLDFIDNNTDITTIFDREMIGTNREQVISLMNEKAKYRRIKGLGSQGGDAITEKYISGELTKVGGWSIATHGFIGKKIVAGQSFSLDQNYDFTKVECLSVNSEALALPMSINTIKDVRNHITANDGIVAKIAFGKGVLYKPLVRVILNEYPTLKELNDAIKLVDKITNDKYATEQEARAAGFKLAGDTRSVEVEQVETKAETKALKKQLKELEDQLSKVQEENSSLTELINTSTPTDPVA